MKLAVFILLAGVRLWAMGCGFPDLDPGSPTARYLALVTRLSETGRLPLEVVEEIVTAENPVNPLIGESHGMRESEAGPFRESFARAVHEPDLDWARIRGEARKIIDVARAKAAERARASGETAPILAVRVLRDKIFPMERDAVFGKMAIGDNGDVYIASQTQASSSQLARLRGNELKLLPLPDLHSAVRFQRADDGKIFLLGFNAERAFRIVDPDTGATVREIPPAEAKDLFRHYRGGNRPLAQIRTEKGGERVLDAVFIPASDSRPVERITLSLSRGAPTLTSGDFPRGAAWDARADKRGHYIVEFADEKMRVWDTSLGHSIFETDFPRGGRQSLPHTYVREGVPGKPIVAVELIDGLRHFDIASGKQTEWRDDVHTSSAGLIDGPDGTPLLYRIFGAYEATPNLRMQIMGELGEFPVRGFEPENVLSFRTPDGNSYVLTRELSGDPKFSITDPERRTTEKFISPVGPILSLATLPDGRVIALTSNGQHVALIQLYGRHQ